MQMLYDSNDFVVVHLNANEGIGRERHCFEIVDKRVNKEVLLDGAWAAAFQKVINSWQENVPSQEEVEAELNAYAELAQLPLLVH